MNLTRMLLFCVIPLIFTLRSRNKKLFGKLPVNCASNPIPFQSPMRCHYLQENKIPDASWEQFINYLKDVRRNKTWPWLDFSIQKEIILDHWKNFMPSFTWPCIMKHEKEQTAARHCIICDKHYTRHTQRRIMLVEKEEITWWQWHE